ncbi:MAG: hypothetical protein Faunusvirus39_8 [Faunusvirus sp.]|jgi:ankyrin repeat protein|uniref:Uncharacterized protein n=1 Tax=Faunusvirus sp. TaxID=2487766 RepID=A0A3G5A2I8_9VIRU|nr:MAG: hypothetical protein Faunusvirus39_8 [Faunusvirus sp.]
MTDETAVRTQLFNYIVDNRISHALTLINSHNDIYKAGYKCGAATGRFDSLIYSVIYSRHEIALALINKHVYLDSYYRNGQTALHYACKHHEMNIACALIKNGANVNLADSYKYTPLSWICIYDDIDIAIAIAMIDKGANVNLKDENNNSPFSIVCKKQKRNYDLIIYMIIHDADVTALNGNIRQHVFKQYQQRVLDTINNSDDNPLKRSFRTTYVTGIIDLICDFIL